MGGTLRIGDIEVHPAAMLFPEMGEADLTALYESVKAHGVRVPLKFYQGKLLDGRNRLRASVMAGLDTRRLPRETIPADVDPFLWAWDANCARLDYSPAQKAAIRLKIEEASGDLARSRAAITEEANRARSEKQTGVPKAESSERRAPRDAPRSEPRKVAHEVAERAHVSPRTVERVMRVKREDPEAFEALASKGRLPRSHLLLARRNAAKNWSVPRAIPAMAAFLRERLTSTERAELVALLSDAAEAA